MGTRADFYVGRGEQAEWLGSVAMDGYPDGIEPGVLHATDEQAFRGAVAAFIASKRHGTPPEMGWPWPWDDSRTTDYAYAFDGGQVWGSCFGTEWFDARAEQPEDGPDEKVAVFPDMSARANVQLGGPRSGLLVFSVPVAARPTGTDTPTEGDAHE